MNIQKRSSKFNPSFYRFMLLGLALAAALAIGLAAVQSARAAVELTVTPLTWNMIGLDSNDVNVGPNNFPVGARVCNKGGPETAYNIQPTFVWDSVDPYIVLRPGSYGSPTGSSYPSIPSLAAGECTDIYFEVQVSRDPAAYDHSRRYHISVTANGGLTGSSPTPRELYVERLVSQSRNYNMNVTLNGVSIPVGGEMNLIVGQTYTIQLVSKTATNGYEQIESFINFPNTIFQIMSVNSTYTAATGGGTPATTTLYNNACDWENDPNSPNYRSCLGIGKAGGDITNTYQIKIIAGGGTSQTLTNLVYDFSGSSYHYNSDATTSYRTANIIDPTSITIAKNFGPNPTNAGGSSTLTLTLYNPNTGTVTGANFIDNLPTSPGAMLVANPPNATTSGCGTPAFTPTTGDSSLSFSNGTIAAGGYCIIKVNVTAPVVGTYTNTTNHLFIGTIDTGNFATASLTANTAPAPPTPTCGLQLATWDFPTTTTAYTFRSSLVSTAAASMTGYPVNGVVAAPSGNKTTGITNAWFGGGYYPDNPTGFPNTPNGPYFQFALDTSRITGLPPNNVSISFSYFLENNWAAGNNNRLYLYSSTDGIAFTHIGTIIPEDKGNWFTAAASATAGSNTTTFRIYAIGRQNDTAQLFLDNIVITGCAVPPPLPIVKSFSPNPIPVGGVSTLSFTLTNENNLPLTGVTFTDALPAGLQVAATPSASTTCGGTPTWAPLAGATTLIFGSPTAATIPARSGTTNGSCTLQVNVTATTGGPHQNVSGFVSSTQTGVNTTTSGYATASLTAILPPQIDKQFSPDLIPVNGVSTLIFVITNPNPDHPLTAVQFSDTFPNAPNMRVAASPNASTTGCGTPTFAPAAGAGSIVFTNGTLAPGGVCTVRVDVAATAVGSYSNTSGAVSADTVGSGNTASDTLTVRPVDPGLAILKRISSSPTGSWTPFEAVPVGASIYYTFTVENTGDVALSLVNVTDPIINPTYPHEVCTLGSLALYEIKTCRVGPISALSGFHPNTARAHGTYFGTVYDSNDSTASYATTGLSLVKSVVETNYTAAGDVLHYTFLVTNTGFAPLREPVTIDDLQTTAETCASTTTVGDADAYLDPDESVTCTGVHIVTLEDVADGSITNTAQAVVEGFTSNQDTEVITWAAADYDDLPSAYKNTLIIDNGARHTIGSLFMGDDVDADPDGQENSVAVGDIDNGVTRARMDWVNNATVNILVDLRTTTFSGTAAVGIWIDWNGNRAFDPATDFYPCTGLATGEVQTCPVTVPASTVYTVGSPVFVRVRLFDQAQLIGGSLDAADSVGLANNGEVEAYLWEFSPTAVTLRRLDGSPSRAVHAWAPFLLLAGALALSGFSLFTWRRRKNS